MASLPGAALATQEEDGAPDDEVIDEITVLGERVAGDPPLGFSLDEEALARMPGTQNDPITTRKRWPGCQEHRMTQSERLSLFRVC
jgi:hypothetical protein